MGVIGNYYLDGVNLASASYVYTDAALTTPAPLGFYSQGGLYREVINASGELGPLNTCQSCISSCPLNIVNDFAGIGLYTIQLDMGVDTGAILITFTPRTTPHGILVNFSGSTYNALSSPVDGYHAAANPVRATYLGDDTDPCSAGLVAGSPYSGVIDYEWLTSSFYATGLQSNVFVSPSDASFTASAAPGDCVMVVPKVSAVTSPITITVASPQRVSAPPTLMWHALSSSPVLLQVSSAAFAATRVTRHTTTPRSTALRGCRPSTTGYSKTPTV